MRGRSSYTNIKKFENKGWVFKIDYETDSRKQDQKSTESELLEFL